MRLRMMLSENRFTLFGIKRPAASCAALPLDRPPM
jgi:hypothetical protein